MSVQKTGRNNGFWQRCTRTALRTTAILWTTLMKRGIMNRGGCGFGVYGGILVGCLEQVSQWDYTALGVSSCVLYIWYVQEISCQQTPNHRSAHVQD